MLSSSPFSLLNELIELLPQLLNLLFMEPILQPEEPSKSDHKMIIKYEEEYHQSALVPMSDFNTIAYFLLIFKTSTTNILSDLLYLLLLLQ